MANSGSRKSDPDADLDVSLDLPKKKGSGGWGRALAVFIALVIVALVVVGAMRKHEADVAREQRVAERSQKLTLMGTQLLAAVNKVQAGDTKAGVEALTKAAGDLSVMASDADANGDTEDQQLLQTRHQTVDKAAKDLAIKQDALTKELVNSLQVAGSALGGVAKPGEKGQKPGAATGPAAATPAPATPAATAAPPALPAPPAVTPPAPPPPPAKR
jgi:hypothetical protein